MRVNADERVKLCNDGKYRWVFEVNMLKNPTILFDVYNVMFMSFIIVFLIVVSIVIAVSFISSAVIA